MGMVEVRLRIGGLVSDPDVARRLILVIAESGLLPGDHREIFSDLCTFRDHRDVLDHMARCKGALEISGEQLHPGLLEVTSFCRRENLPYERVTELSPTPRGMRAETMSSTWLPDFEREMPSSRVGGEIVIPMTLLSAALKIGIGAVTDLHDTYRILREFEAKLVVEEGILERLKAIPDDEWDDEVTMQSTPPKVERGPAP
jgi:hypothetical protein